MTKKLKKLFKGTPQTPVPRTTEEIKSAYFDVRARAGEAQYHASILELELKQLNQAMQSLNNEMAERNKLDKAVADEAAKNAPKTEASPQ